MTKSREPAGISETALDEIRGGGEYLAPGVYVEEISFKAGTGSAGLRSDGDLVQSVSETAPRRR